MFTWTPDMVAFMRDAADFGGFHRELADTLARLLGEREHICDAGCGTGELACALAERYPRVTAVDISPLAAMQARARAAQLRLKNIEVIQGDILSSEPGAAPYDAMTFCFFGSIEEILKIGAAQCRGTLAAVMKDYPNHRFSIGTQPLRGHTAALAAMQLDELGIAYRLEHLTLEMGQPFRSVSDAVRFFKIYSRDENPEDITPEAVAQRLRKTGRTDFPLYLPGERKMGILLIETDNLTDRRTAE